MLPPSVVLPVHDLDGLIFHHIDGITPFLKQHFSAALLGISEFTAKRCQNQVNRLSQDDFFQILISPQDAQVGGRFKLLYLWAASLSHPDQILHLCFPDRLAFALQDKFRDQFLEDIKSIKPEHTPIIFQRSQKAWETHPRNYYEIENFVATVSRRLLGKTIDFAWCHLAIQAYQLAEILTRVQKRDMSMVAEMIIPLIDSVNSQYVDWLAWEDPYISSSNPEAL